MFPIGFRVQVDPEFLPDGGDTPQRIPAGLARIGAVLRLAPDDAEPWDIAVGASSWWRTPSAHQIALISDSAGFVIDVAERTVLLEEWGVTRIWEAQESGLVLFVTFTDVTA